MKVQWILHLSLAKYGQLPVAYFRGYRQRHVRYDLYHILITVEVSGLSCQGYLLITAKVALQGPVHSSRWAGGGGVVTPRM